MGLNWLLFIQLFCIPVKIQYYPEHGFDKRDRIEMLSAARHCYEVKYPYNPCLKEFIKLRTEPHRAYYGFCGIEDGDKL